MVMNNSFLCLAICDLAALLVEILESVLMSNTNTVFNLDLSCV